MQIRKSFEAIEYKFVPFERDSNCSNATSKYSSEIWSNQMKIRSIGTKFEAIKCKFEPSK